MNRRSILYWVSLAAIFIAASAVMTKAQSQTSGTLRVLDNDGKLSAECPLKHTAVKAEVSGFMSRVTVTQNFENPFTDKIEAVYTFPLPEMAAVDDLTMEIGERTIKGKIMRRDDASEAYAAAKKMGKVASLLDQERANVFTQHVANILPGQQIRVTISYVETLKYEDGSYAWTFPMVVAPRYSPPEGDSNKDRLSPPRLPAGMRAGHDVSLEINLNAGVPIFSLNSASHEIDVQQVDEKRAVVRLKDHATIPNKDFLLTYGVAGDSIKDAVLSHHSDRGGFFTLILQPPQRVQAEDVMPKEMVFVLDTSGSMLGAPLETAKKTMELALDTLYPHDTFNLITFSGDTQILFGADYRRLAPIVSLRATEQNVLFDGVAQAIAGTAARINDLVHSAPQTPVFNNFSLYGQDSWRQSPRFTLTFGMRWELGTAPSHNLAPAVDQISDPTTLKLAAPGTPLWSTTFGNFAPRAGFAYELSNTYGAEVVLRGGVNILYDRGYDRSGDIFANSIPFIAGSSVINLPFTGTEALPLLAFDPRLRLPYTINWNVMAQRNIGSRQSVSFAYIGSSGRRLLHTQTLFDRNPDFSFLRLTTNRSRSNHNALQFTFERMYRSGLATLVSYTWADSEDNVIHDSDRRLIMMSSNPELDYGHSDFDIRHQFNGFISYAFPAPHAHGLGYTLFRNWQVESIFNARSAKPFNFFHMFPTSIGVAYSRPEDMSRNSLRGFPLYQIDLALRRRFHFTDDFSLQFQADAFNLFNHTNFEDPLGNDLVLGTPFRPKPAFGESTSLSGRSLSNGFLSFYGVGGARTLRFSLKLVF